MAAPIISAEWAMCSWLAMKAPDERPETDTCAGSTGEARRRPAAEAEAQASINDSAIASRTMSRPPGGWASCHCPRAIALCKPRIRIVARQPQTPRPARPYLLERGADLVEHRADLPADQRDGGDDEHRNKTGDQRIFDRSHTGFIDKKVFTNSKHGILLTLYGPLRSQAAAVPKPRPLKWAQDPDHDAKYHLAIANRSIGSLKFYRPPVAGRDCSLILNLVPIRTQK